MTDGKIDAKLNHLVRKFLSSENNGKDTASPDQVVDWLRKKYREYNRDRNRLRCQVQTVLTHIQEKNAEEQYDKEARDHDNRRNKMHSSTNGLNASLTNRYRKLQQTRDAEEEANRALQTAEAGDLNEMDDMNAAASPDKNDGVDSKKRSRDESNGSMLEKRSSKLIGTGKSTKRKKRNSTKSGHTSPTMKGKEGAANVCEAVPRPTERYTDLGGMGDVLTQIRQLVEYPLVRPELYRHLGVDPPRGVLLRGPPG